MRIKTKVLEKIDGNKSIVSRLCLELNKAYPTIRKWINENDDNLTKAAALQIIREELNLTDDQILDRQKEAA